LAHLWCYEQLVGETGREREKREREWQKQYVKEFQWTEKNGDQL
jgi:hypothetical protein